MAINIAVYLLISLPAAHSQVNLNDPVLSAYLHALGFEGRILISDIHRHISAYDLLVFQYGFRPAEFSPLTLMTSLFLHGGLMHLAGNMLFLFIFGDNVEFRLGPLPYLVTYLGCGVAATLFFSLFALGSQTPLIGASGAIFGVLGCYFLWFPRNRVRCFLFLFPFIMTSVYLSSRLVLGFYLVIDNLLPFVFTGGSSSGIAHGAHIGGFFAGLGIAWWFDRYYLFVTRRRRKRSKPKADTLAGSADKDLGTAVEQYLRFSRRENRSRIDSPQVIAMGEYLSRTGQLPEALKIFRNFIADRPADPLIAQAYLGAGKVLLSNPRQLTAAYHYFLAAHDQAQTEQLAEEAQRFLRLIERQKGK